MTKQAQASEPQRDKKNHPAVETAAPEMGQDSIDFKLPGSPVAAAGSGSVDGQASLLVNRQWQNGQQRAMAARIGQIQGNGHLQRVMASLKSEKKGSSYVIQREGPTGSGHKAALAIPFTWTGGEKVFNAPIGSMIARKVYWTFEGSFIAGDQVDKPGDKGVAVGPAGGGSKDKGPSAGFKIEDVQRLCSDEFGTADIKGLTALDTKESFQLTSEAIDISVALEGSVGVTFKKLNLQAGASFTGQLALLKKEFAYMKDGKDVPSKPMKFANASFAFGLPVAAWQPAEGITIQGKLSGIYEVEPNWAEILRRITQRLGQAATSAAIETAIATGFVLGGVATLAAAYANIAEGDWVGAYCQQKSQAMVDYLLAYEGCMRGASSGGNSAAIKDANEHKNKVYEQGVKEGASRSEIDEAIKAKPQNFYAAGIWNQTKARYFAEAEADYWKEHSITHTLHEWGFGSDEKDRDFRNFKRALNAHIDGKLGPLFGLKADWL